ncbi:protein ELYS isoform X2 [Odontomachus brunneus]|uniref:protein ELYS isoform X2 n=1 Tax=Odontomachus brunneus TaxID=486640 RepID=UPI0013F1CB01|nr:protein ELYS isoform X2 [Odontomachus brunneus]
MKEFEEVNCEIRRIVDLPLSVSNRLRNLETEDQNQSTISQEHDINNCYGGFLHNAMYAWLSYDCYFVVFNAKTGESISSWTFRGTVTSISQFPTQSGDLPLLLVGIDNRASKPKDSSGLLCIFDCTVSRVLRAIRMPCGIEKVCVVSGGAEWEEFNEKRPDNILNEMDGIACVVLHDLQHIMIDLRRSTWDIHDLSVVMDETSPAEMDLLTKQVGTRHQFNQERHAAYNLLNSRIEKYIGFNREEFESSPLVSESLTTAIVSSTKIGCLISGCLGRVIIWQNDGSVGWISVPIDENMAVTHLALLEPTDDPRPFYYLWVVFQDESSSKTPSVLRMYAMLFERKYCDRGMNLYFNLEADPNLKFEFELNENDRVIGLCTIERETNPEQTDSGVKRGEDNLLLISTSERTLLFDLNQWYKEQMPRTIDECQNPNSILATYRARAHFLQQKYDRIMSFAYVPLSLQEFPSNGPNSPEELFYPNSLSLEWIELCPTGLTFWMTRGIQADLLREMAIAGPVILLQPSETFHRCLSVGLMPFNSEFSLASDYNAQREMLLSLCLEQRWSTFLVKCALDWADGSASYLYSSFLKWGVQRASTIKMLADRLCVPLFDQSGSGIGEADVRTLRFCSQQLECLSNVVAKLPFGTADLTNQRRMLKRVSMYFQVLLWFYDVGLLPETQELEEESTLPISLALKVPYPYEKLSTSYKEKRAQAARTTKESNDDKNEEEVLFIDELMTRECSVLKEQWEKEGGVGALGGCYPPPSLQSLLRSYLTDCHHIEPHEVSYKHQITIYLLMDLAMLLQRLYPGVDQLIKYPSAFKMSPSLIKLTQAFWLLDHEDYQGFLDMMTGQLVSDSDVKDWHHRFILRTLVRNNQHKLALVYLRVRKPPLSSMEEQSVAVSLSVEHGLVQSAFHRRPPCHYEQLLTCFFRACKTYGKLDEILHLALDPEEEEVFVKFLEENKTEDVRLLYYLQRCRYTEAITSGDNHQTIVRYQSNFAEDAQPMLSMLGAYNTTLPDITKRFSVNAAATNLDVDLETRYPRPMSHCKSHDQLRGIHEAVITKARETYLRGEKCQIPFVSAPCTSLKLNNQGSNVNCVLFPVRKTRRINKRTVNQIYENVEDTNDEMVDSAKRRKLSDGTVSPNRSNGKTKESELSFATPLVKRKFNASTNKDIVSETPQSILKIKRLIRSSPISPTTSVQEKITDRLVDNQSKKISRQIRFSINQPKKTLQYEDEDEKKEEHEKKEKVEDEKNEDEEQNNSILSEGNDVFLSPNAKDKSYNETAVLSANSSNSSNFSRSYCFPRPRPSLRRSALQSSVEMFQESLSSNVGRAASDTLPINTSAKTSLAADEANKPPAFTVNTSGRCSSLLSAAFGDSTTILSSNSNVDITDYSLQELKRATPQSRWSFSVEKNRISKFISSTPLTKGIVSLKRANNEQVVDEDIKEKDDKEEEKKEEEIEEKEDMKSKLSVRNTCKIEEELDMLSESERFSSIEQSAYDRNELPEQQSSLKENVQNEQDESKYNNGGITRRETLNVNEEQPAFSNPEKVAEPSLTASDKSDEELLQLQYSLDDDDEVFKSLSTTLEDAQMQVESEVPISCLPDVWNPEEHDLDKKSNGLKESMRLTGDIDFTDDESMMSKDAMILYESDDVNEKKIYSTVTTHSESILYDIPNITDDESDSSVKEIEESKTKNGKLSDLPRRYATKQSVVEAEKKSESDETNGKSDRRDNTVRRDISETPALPDVEFREKLSETASSSKCKRNQIESQDDQSARVTRSHRASSLTKDIVANTSSSQVLEMERVTRSRRGSSVAKDTVCPMNSSSQDIIAEKLPRTRRASSMAKDSLTDSPAQSADEFPRLRRASSNTFDSLADPLTQETDVGKSSRLRRASSTKDISLSVKPRSRRANSLVKEVLMSSTATDEDLRSAASTELVDSMDTSMLVKRGRSRSTSVAKEIPPSDLKDSKLENVKNEPTVRRSARLTSSMKKESQVSASRTRTRSESSSSLPKQTSDDEEVEEVDRTKNSTKKSVRAKRSSTMTMSRSFTADLEKQPEVIKASRGRRGSSVPKEITVQTGRKRRSSSIIREIIPEDAELSLESLESPRRLRSSVTRNTKEIVDSPAVNTRRRGISIQSIPEELEEILSQSSSRETRSTARKATAHVNARERRAASADVSYKQVKIKLRRISSMRSIVEEPIAEEPVGENEDRRELREEADSKITRDVAPARRRRAASTTAIEDTKKDEATQRNRGKTRRTSVNEENSNLFSFSQPEKMDDVPLDEKDIGEVPNYVFSSPHTRSKNILPNQHQN